MKEGIHPEYREVVFQDYTGAQQRIIETGRVEKFRQKFARTGAPVAKA